MITNRVMVDGLKIGYMYRESPDDPQDRGWCFFSGDESPEYLDDPSHIGIYAVNTAANYDPSIIPHLATKDPCAFEKDRDRGGYQRIEEA